MASLLIARYLTLQNDCWNCTVACRNYLDLLLTDEEPYDNQPIFKLACQVSYVGNDSALCQAVEELRWRCLVFDRLREAMRIAPVDGGNGLNDEGTAEAISTIRQGVEKFRRETRKEPETQSRPSLSQDGRTDRQVR